MSLLNIDDEIYDEVRKYVEENSIDYPSIKNFVDKTLREKVEKLNKNLKED